MDEKLTPKRKYETLIYIFAMCFNSIQHKNQFVLKPENSSKVDSNVTSFIFLECFLFFFLARTHTILSLFFRVNFLLLL